MKVKIENPDFFPAFCNARDWSRQQHPNPSIQSARTLIKNFNKDHNVTWVTALTLSSSYIEFDSESAYTMFLLKWS